MKKLSKIYKKLGIAFSLPIEIRDANGKVTYYETINGFWFKKEYDDNGNETYSETSNGYKKGTPSKKSFNGKTIEIDGLKYELKLKK